MKTSSYAVLLILMIGLSALIWPNLAGMSERQQLLEGKEHLLKLIEAEERFFQVNGKYLPLDTQSDVLEFRRSLNWSRSERKGCDYAVAVSGIAFTVEARCILGNGTENYLGIVRTAPGEGYGIDGKFGKCKAHGIFTETQPLVNVVGPCRKQKGDIISFSTGNRRSLIINTLPSDAIIEVNGTMVGRTDVHLAGTSYSYGTFYWENPAEGLLNITVSKEGFIPINFTVDWAGYTHTEAITLRQSY